VTGYPQLFHGGLDVGKFEEDCPVSDFLEIKHQANFPYYRREANAFSAREIVQNNVRVSGCCHFGDFG
jgi:hypothetical protein